MIQLVKFEAEHVKRLANHGGQEAHIGHMTEEDIDDIAKHSYAFSLLKGELVIGCVGCIHINQYRATTWAILQKTSAVNFIHVHRWVLWGLNEAGYKRYEAYVDPQFKPATRWVQLLGFKIETPYIPYYFPNGAGATSWVLMRE